MRKLKTVITILGSSIIPVAILILLFIDMQSKHITNMVKGGGIGIARIVEADTSFVSVQSIDDIDTYKDVRSIDVSNLNLQSYLKSAPYLTFNTQTKWSNNLPKDFNPDEIIEICKNPGLGVRSLHKQGIDGSGVSIAIIDQNLYTGHEEYKDNLVHYEEMDVCSKKASMHGSAVASLAVGKEVGVAPGSKLYYISSFPETTNETSSLYNYAWITNAINRLLDINEQLPENEKIRVISISKGFSIGDKGVDKLLKEIDRAKAQNVFVITTANEMYYNYSLYGLGKADILGDPDNLDTNTIGNFERNNPDLYTDGLFVPMDARTYAGFTGEKDYEWAYDSGLSWTCPYLAGIYALSAQVKPDITPDEFIEAAFQTADSKDVNIYDKTYTLKYIINPVKLIQFLQEER